MRNILIICSEFNKEITSALLSGTEKILKQNSQKATYEVVWVPGAFEIPTAASIAVETEKYEGIICLGAVIKGESAHFDFVAQTCANRISELGVDSGLPIIFGVLTVYNLNQALERCGLTSPGSNHGEDYAKAALKMFDAIERIEE